MVHRRQHARGADMALALMRGFEVTGIRAEMTDDDQRPADVDVACVWGASQRELWTAYAELGIPLLVAEQGYVGDRTHWNALGWNGINGQADFVHDDVPADRWRRYHRASLQPWSGLRSDGYILVIGQVQADNSVDTDLSRWYDEVTQHAASLRQVKFRCHPLRPHTTPPAGATVLTGSLEEALAGAFCVVTYSSTSGVEALLAGLPTMAASPMSMAFPVAAHTLADLVSRDEDPDRVSWANRLAYCQWTLREISAGDAWRHLSRRIPESGPCH